MNVIEGQANRRKRFSLIFCSLTFNNILNIIVMLILVGVSVTVALNGGSSNNPEDSTEPENPTEYTAYSVGDPVTIGTENFYVLKDSDATQEKVTLLAKDCIDTTTLLQSADADKPAFSSTDYWSTIEGITYPYDLNDTPTSADTDVIAKARAYGTALGGTGRLMTKEEAEVLETANSDILYGRNGKSSNTYLNYCLGSARDTGLVWTVSGFNSGFYSVPFDVANTYGIRPVVEISRSNIS